MSIITIAIILVGLAGITKLGIYLVESWLTEITTTTIEQEKIQEEQPRPTPPRSTGREEKKESRFGRIITARPEGMPFSVYKEKRKKQQKEIQKYLHG